MDFLPLLSLIKESKNIGICTHENADADGVGASLALKQVLDALGKNASVIAPRSVSKLGKRLAEFSGEVVDTSPSLKGFDLVIFVDVKPSKEKKIWKMAIIDHHEGSSEFPADFTFIDPKFTSASEMVFEFMEYLMDENEIDTISEKIAMLLLSGIVADTADLKLSVKETLERIIRIGSITGVELRNVFSFLRTPQDPSLRMACLKGTSRLRIRMTEGVFIVTTQVSSFQGDVASKLLRLGADVAFAGGKKKEKLNVSGRARTDLVDRGLSLARVMEIVASKIGGEGGGHAGAAALRGKGDVDEVLTMCVNETKKEVKPRPRKDQELPKVTGSGGKGTKI